MSDKMTKFQSTCVLIFSTVCKELKHIFHQGQDKNNTRFLLNSEWGNRDRMQKSPDL